MAESYKDLEKEYKSIEKRIIEKSDECAVKGLSFDEMIEQTKDDRNKLFDLSKKMRLIQEPIIEFGKTWKGDTYTFEQFSNMCKNGLLTDNDGFGYYATETAKSNVEILPSDILENKYRTDFTHVIWFNK